MTFEELVRKRKDYDVKVRGFINQSQIEPKKYDQGNYIDPWQKWHCSIPSNILVIGQDWGGKKYYCDNKGKDKDSNPTCKNLISLFKEIGLEIGTPSEPNKKVRVHFANLIPFLRTGGMQGSDQVSINEEIIRTYSSEFLKPLIESVQPKLIITLGIVPFKGVACIFDTNTHSKDRLIDIVEKKSPIRIGSDLLIFPMFHCGSGGINRNRKLDQQKDDWRKIKKYL